MLRSLASTLTFTEWNRDEKKPSEERVWQSGLLLSCRCQSSGFRAAFIPLECANWSHRSKHFPVSPSLHPAPARFPERGFFCMSGVCLSLELRVGGGFGWLCFWLGWLWCCISGLPAFGSWSKNLKILENSCLVASFKHTGNNAGRPFYSILTQLPGSLGLYLWIKNSDLQQSTDTSTSLSLSPKDMACMKNKNCITCKKLPALDPWKHRSPTRWM